jgi:cytidylate kinase
MENQNNIVTIDGPAWTGKSTISKRLAILLNYKHINTGSMFRATAVLLKRNNLNIDNKKEIVKLLRDISMDFKFVNNESHLFVNGEDFTLEIDNNELVPLASKVATIPEVRETLLSIQRKISSTGNFIVEGRDCGTIVFPNAKWKFFLKASTEIRISRFFKLLEEKDQNKYTGDEVRKIILETDERDKNRKIAPLRKPKEAIIYDNSSSPSADQDAAVLWYYVTHKQELIENYNRLSLVK